AARPRSRKTELSAQRRERQHPCPGCLYEVGRAKVGLIEARDLGSFPEVRDCRVDIVLAGLALDRKLRLPVAQHHEVDLAPIDIAHEPQLHRETLGVLDLPDHSRLHVLCVFPRRVPPQPHGWHGKIAWARQLRIPQANRLRFPQSQPMMNSWRSSTRTRN